MRRSRELAERGITSSLQVGVAGYGASKKTTDSWLAVTKPRSIGSDFLNPRAFAHDRVRVRRASAGAGHFVKMVHNGAEYGMMQAYANEFAEQAISDPYRRLLQDALAGDAPMFIRSDDIEEAWAGSRPGSEALRGAGWPAVLHL